MVDKEKLEFVEEILKEIERIYPEEFGEAIFQMTTCYGGELFHDRLYITWTIEDVKEMKQSLTEEQCKEVLSYLGKHHTASEGINWEVLSTTIGMMDFDLDEDEEFEF